MLDKHGRFHFKYSIHERPIGAEKRTQIELWEVLVVMLDRASRLTLIKSSKSKKASDGSKTLAWLLHSLSDEEM